MANTPSTGDTPPGGPTRRLLAYSTTPRRHLWLCVARLFHVRLTFLPTLEHGADFRAALEKDNIGPCTLRPEEGLGQGGAAGPDVGSRDTGSGHELSEQEKARKADPAKPPCCVDIRLLLAQWRERTTRCRGGSDHSTCRWFTFRQRRCKSEDPGRVVQRRAYKKRLTFETGYAKQLRHKTGVFIRREKKKE